MANILVVDDSDLFCAMMTKALEVHGHAVSQALSLKEALDAEGDFDVVFLDVDLPDGNGILSVPLFLAIPSRPEIIIVTASGDADGATLAIKSGVWDYIEKGTSLKNIELALARALLYRQEKMKAPVRGALSRGNIVGGSPQISECLDLLGLAADSEASVLLMGETGTGKELFARAVHENSRRRHGSFVVVDCATLPASMAESILFGHDKGAFTGADRRRAGLIKQADGGTLFLDEVGELSLEMQKTFLRVLQERFYRHIGDEKETQSDFRLVAATNKDLDKMVEDSTFRRDLLYRLRAFFILIPPLREHPGDILELVKHYMTQFCGKYSLEEKTLSPECADVLSAYSWPGNVRELVNTVERIVLETRYEPCVYPKHLPIGLREHYARRTLKSGKGDLPKHEISGSAFGTWKDVKDREVTALAKRYFGEVLTHAEGDMDQVCRITGMSRPNVYSLLRKYRIAPKKWSS